MTLLLAVALSLPARADIGPPPDCAAGTHSEYLMGRRCVKDGFHLAQDASGAVVEVADGAAPTEPPADPATPTPPTPPADPTTVIPEAAPATPAAPAAPAATEARCATAPGAGFLGLGLALALAARRRAGQGR